MGAIFSDAAAQWRDMKADYDDALEASYLAAESATNGYLLTRRATMAGVSSWSLFKGPAGKAYVNASEELIDWWETHPRLSLAAFERQWLRNQEQADCPDCLDRVKQDDIAADIAERHGRCFGDWATSAVDDWLYMIHE